MKPRHPIAFAIALLACTGAAAAEKSKPVYPAYAVDVPTADHYKWGDHNDGWRMVAQKDMSVVEQRMAPGSAEINHRHRKARQFFYVLSGELTMNVDGEDTVLKPGQGMEIAPGRQHQARNRSVQPVQFLVMSTPPSQTDLVEVKPEKNIQQAMAQ
jgi:mannose-6-phosphate isomerase-like protein (cupin superfamily)